MTGRLTSSAALPEQTALDDRPDVPILEYRDVVARGGNEHSTLPPLPGPDRRGGDRPMPRVPAPDLLGGGGQHVVVGIAQHPVLLGDQLEVADPLGDRMAG